MNTHSLLLMRAAAISLVLLVLTLVVLIGADTLPEAAVERLEAVGAMLGEPLKLNGRSRDEVTWTCGPGPGLMTRYAAVDYNVSMRLRPIAKCPRG